MPGQGVSKGLCYAKALLLEDNPIVYPEETQTPDKEEAAFMEARAAVQKDTEELCEKVRGVAGNDMADILDAHISILQDAGLIDPILEFIRQGNNAAKAVAVVMDALISQFKNMENEYFAQRASDLEDIKDRLIRKILHIEKPDLSFLSEPTILIGKDITPSVVAGIDMKNVAGMIMEMGGITSHTAILARTMDIPAIVGAKGILGKIRQDEMLGFNGETGKIYLSMSEEERREFCSQIEIEKENKKKLEELSSVRARTADGRPVKLYGNIGTPEDVRKVIEKGGEGIGLFRSEFLYLASPNLPTEELQFQAYKEVLEEMKEKVVVVRTLDIGGDKDVPAMSLQKEENPFLGLRAIRLCHKKTEIFHIQLRALLRASVFGNLRIMFPMISTLKELLWAKEQLEICKKQLIEERISCSENIPVGIMVEIPSVAIMAEVFAKHCDFFSIGTNDLTQYTLAVDRGNEAIAHLYSYFHPSVIRMIKNAIDGAHSRNIPCDMCGEAAGDIRMIPLLLGMELDEYSMSASSILGAKEILRKLSIDECKELLKIIMNYENSEEIEQTLNDFIKEKEKVLC